MADMNPTQVDLEVTTAAIDGRDRNGSERRPGRSALRILPAPALLVRVAALALAVLMAACGDGDGGAPGY